MDAQSIKRQALDLAGRLKEWERQLDDGSLKLADVRQDFEKRYQPHALELMDEMTKLVPSETFNRPYVAMTLPSNDAENAVIEASVQFGKTALILKQLAAAMPEPENA